MDWDYLKIETVVSELLARAVQELPKDVVNALYKAYETETNSIARTQYKAILENLKLATELKLPICQDTGLITVYLKLPSKNPPDPLKLKKAIINGVRLATKNVPLRPNAVHPLTRKNTGDNVGNHIPYINYEYLEQEIDWLEITVLPKGAGSENMSLCKMLTPGEGLAGIKKLVLETVAVSGGKPCPPIIVGIGLGGTMDLAAKLAKQALLRPIDNEGHPEAEIRVIETELYTKINELGIGPMGLGGKQTALAVNIEYAHCHTASLPVAINIQCWAARRKTARVYPDGTVNYI